MKDLTRKRKTTNCYRQIIPHCFLCMHCSTLYCKLYCHVDWQPERSPFPMQSSHVMPCPFQTVKRRGEKISWCTQEKARIFASLRIGVKKGSSGLHFQFFPWHWAGIQVPFLKGCSHRRRFSSRVGALRIHPTYNILGPEFLMSAPFFVPWWWGERKGKKGPLFARMALMASNPVMTGIIKSIRSRSGSWVVTGAAKTWGGRSFTPNTSKEVYCVWANTPKEVLTNYIQCLEKDLL